MVKLLHFFTIFLYKSLMVVCRDQNMYRSYAYLLTYSMEHSP